jgi:transposase InsO family protein
MAIAQTGKEDLHGLIHHSDRGIQYCCNAYVEELESHGISISMTEDYKPTDNAVAERVNGIIKQELIYRRKQFASYEEAKEAIERFITFYNNDRPHMSIGFQTPTVAHQQVGAQQRHWKGYYERCQQKQDNECKQI